VKRRSRYISAVILISVLLIFAGSCKKDDKPDYDYFVSKEYKISYTKSEIINLLGLVEKSFPEVNELKQSVSSDVDIYKVVYETTVGAEVISASGLVCVPKTSAEYPVLCFQNGTNTVKANAPSEYVGNPLYQMIEIVASLGYIVVIPDYPGFGESAEITHPYLIVEPTVQSIIDMLYAVKESGSIEFPGIIIKNEYYLIGYSQGGWATMALHKKIEQNYSADFKLSGSACGAGPYDMKMLFREMISSQTYNSPVFLGYIAYAYSAYNQFTNPIAEIFNEPYATRLGSLFTGNMTSALINEQLSPSIPELIRGDLISGFETSGNYASIREALELNSITAWKTEIPLLLLHGGDDISVNPLATEIMYGNLIQAGTSSEICTKEIVPGVDHGKGIVPCMIRGLMFLRDLREKNR
jgi:pimeloyl-ACP methyl ester carboxylesterase